MPLPTKLCVPSISTSYTSSSAIGSIERIFDHAKSSFVPGSPACAARVAAGRFDGTCRMLVSSLSMTKASDITVIDDKNLRGVVAARGRISKDTLEDIIDLIELSSPESIEEDDRRIAEADKANSWIPYAEVKKRARRAR